MMPAEINTDSPAIYVIFSESDFSVLETVLVTKVEGKSHEVTENRYTGSAGNCGQPANAGYAQG